MNNKLEHGAIWLANLNPGRGVIPGKVRPVLIVQNQALLDVNHPSTLIIPMTTNVIENAQPLRIKIKASGQLQHDSDLLIDQIRAIDNRRLISGPLFRCGDQFMRMVQLAVQEVMGFGFD